MITEVRQARQNGYAERLLGTVKKEKIDLSKYRNFTETSQQIEWLLENVYVKKRIYLPPDYLTSEEYERKWNE
ncbi:MAG: hypothetical protein Kow00121_51720 [Elainellaceae cyanobacterium]